MKSLVIYATTSGNTRAIAMTIADALRRHGSVQVFEASDAPARLPPADLVLIGGPTERRTMTEAMLAFLDRLEAASIEGAAVVAFDTRLRWPRIMSGSAADDIAKRLRTMGARLIAANESFMVTSKPELEPGELARAGGWATGIADLAELSAPVTAS